jgi:recombinational DNA repair ATPase RecF
MAVGPEELVQLKSNKAQLEVGLIYLKRRRAELEKRRALLQREAHGGDSTRLDELVGQIAEVGGEIESRESAVARLAEEIAHAERQAEDDTLGQLLRINDQMAGELGEIRAEVLEALRGLAEPLRRYQELADRKTQLVKRLSNVSARDLSYPNYLDCALFRQVEQDEALRFVLDVLKRQRVVA